MLPPRANLQEAILPPEVTYLGHKMDRLSAQLDLMLMVLVGFRTRSEVRARFEELHNSQKESAQ